MRSSSCCPKQGLVFSGQRSAGVAVGSIAIGHTSDGYRPGMAGIGRCLRESEKEATITPEGSVLSLNLDSGH